MARRIDIELTSTRPDGTWTWRAAGAKEPRGVLEGSLLYDGAKAGDVVRAEAEFEIDGISITSVTPPKSDNRREPERIEVIGSSRTDAPGVTTQLLGRTARRREGPDGRSGREGRPTRERPPRDRAGREQPGTPGRQGPRQDRARQDRADRANQDGTDQARTGQDRTGQDRTRQDRTRQERTRQDRTEQGGTGEDRRVPERSDRDRDRAGAPDRRTQRRDGPPARREGGAGRSVRPGPGRPEGREQSEGDRKSKRLSPGHAHRQAMLESLAPEQRPIAEQVLRGGIPAVRTALHLEREKAAAEGRAAPNTDQLIAMAEELLPRLKAAEWRDRAEAAAKDPDNISLRDLRSVVAGSEVARDDETRALAATLREALERRVAGLHEQWAQEIAKHLDEGRVVRALRLSARPPEPLARLDAELSQRLSDAASEGLAPDAPSDRWLALLEAGASSPVRRTIRPAGLPAEASPEVKQAAYQQSGRIPALAAMLGVSIPPPPTPSARRARPPAGPPKPARRRPAPDVQEGAGDSPDPAAQTPETPQSAGDSPPAKEEPESGGDARSAEGGENSTVVQELGESLGEPQVGDFG